MHAVGDMADGHLILGLPPKQTSPHGPRDFTVQSRDGIGATGESQSEHCHAKKFVRIVRVLASEAEQAVLREAQGFA